MNVFAKLKDVVAGVLSSRKKMNAYFTKKDMVQYIGYLRNLHVSVVAALDGPMGAMADGLSPLITGGKGEFSLYTNFRKSMSPSLRSKDAKIPLSTLIDANKAFIKVLDDVEHDIESAFAINKIGILNMRMSHMVIGGVLKQSSTLSKYTRFAFSYVTNGALGNGALPKYRTSFILDNSEEVASICNMLDKGGGALAYRSHITTLKQTAADRALVSLDAESQVDRIEESVDLNDETSHLITSGIVGLPDFQTIGEFVNIIRHEISKFLLQETDWMKSNLALLQMKMSGVDPKDPEYIKLEKVVSKYESIIDTLERVREKVG